MSKPATEQIAELRRRVRILTRALLFYARGQNYNGFDDWEAPDEPNWMCPPLELPTEEAWEQMMLETGGVAAAALRKAYGRKLTKYEHHTSRGYPVAEVCQHALLKIDCGRCHPEGRPI